MLALHLQDIHFALMLTEDLKMSEELKRVPVNAIQPNRFQPRKRFDDKTLAELADSIDQNGLIQPIIVRKIDDGEGEIEYELIAGERRWRAHKLLDKPRINALVREMSDEQSEQSALIENLQREDLNPIEIAESINALLKRPDMTQQKLADQIGKSRAYIANWSRLVKLDESAKQLVETGKVDAGTAIHMLTLPAENQRELIEKAIEKDWTPTTIRQNVAKLKKKLEKVEAAEQSGQPIDDTQHDTEDDFDEANLILLDCHDVELRKELTKHIRDLLKKAELTEQAKVSVGVNVRTYLKQNGMTIKAKEESHKKEAEAA